MASIPDLLESLHIEEGRHPSIYIDTWASTVTTLKINGLSNKGQINQTLITNNDRSWKGLNIPIAAYPIFLSVATLTVIKPGQCYVRVVLMVGSVTVGVLMEGYVSRMAALVWPGGHVAHELMGPGNIRSVTGTDPAAGSEISETVPTNAVWKLLSLYIPFVTDATVADRYVSVTFDDGTKVFFGTGSGTAHSASSTIKHIGHVDAVETANVGGAGYMFPLPHLLLPQGYRIVTVTGSIQAGDNFGAPQLLVEEWIQE